MAKRGAKYQGAAIPGVPSPLKSQSIALSDLSFADGDALRVEDVMRILHLSRNTVYKLARDGSLPSYRVGRQIRFRYEDVRIKLESTADVPTDQDAAQNERSAHPANPEPAHLAPASDVLDKLPTWARDSRIVGGQDMAADVLANYLASLGIKNLRSHDNAYVSLARMYMGTCDAAVVDLWSESERRYNAPYLRQMLPGVPSVLFRLYKRRIGFTVPARNPLGIRSWIDLIKPEISLANREHGSGPRVLLDEKLKYLEANCDAIEGYSRTVSSELAASLLVARGLANVAITSEKPFRQVKGLDFIPAQDEYVDLAILKTPQTKHLIQAVRSLLRTDAFRSEFDPSIYDTSLTGEIVYEC